MASGMSGRVSHAPLLACHTGDRTAKPYFGLVGRGALRAFVSCNDSSGGSGPSRNFQAKDGDRIENVGADKARLDSGSSAISVDPVEQEICSDGEIGSDIAKKCGVRIKGGANHRALTVLAAVNAELQGFQDGIVLGWVVCVCHASIVRAGDAGRQRSNVAKGGWGVWFLKRNKSERGHVHRGQPPRRPSLIHRELAANREAARSSERTARLLPASP